MTQEPITAPVSAPAPAAGAAFRPAVTGVVPPQLGEGLIREAWPTLLGIAPALATLGKGLMRTVVLAPLGFLVILPAFLLKLAPFVCRRYTLTNRRLMVRRGWKPAAVQEVPLSAIDDVRLHADGVDPFYVSGTLEVIGNGQVVLTLPGVPEPEGFRLTIINAVKAWVPGKASGPFVPASSLK